MAAHAEDERLAPVLYLALRGGQAPAPVLARLRAAWIAAERQELLAPRQLREVVAAFDVAGIETILLKGPVLGAEYYPDAALRPFTDLDLVVRGADRQQAIDVLGTLGYAHASPTRSLSYELEHAPAAYFVAAADASRLPVDLHWQFVAHPGGSRATELAAEEIWSRAVPAPSWGGSARIPAAEDLLVYLAAHFAVHHALAGLLWQVDLALVLKRHESTLDWDAVATRARRWSAATALYFALRAVGDRLGVVPPAETMARLRPAAWRRALVDRLQRAGPDRLARLEYLVGLLVLDRVSAGVRTLASGLAPRPGWLRSRYDSRSLASGYLAHYRRVAAIVVRSVGRPEGVARVRPLRSIWHRRHGAPRRVP